MTSYLIRRALLIIPTLFFVTVLTFLLARASVNPALARGGGESGGKPMTDELLKALEHQYGWDKPPLVAYGEWIGNVLQGNLGTSTIDHRPVLTRIAERLPITLSLNICSVIVIYLSGVPVGIYSALRRDRFEDKGIALVLFAAYSIPVMAMATILITYVCGADYLNLLPMYGINSFDAPEMTTVQYMWDRAVHMILPVFCLSYAGLAFASRYGRLSVLESIGQDFVRTARAKGLPESLVIWRHAVRNALLPMITIFALELPGLLAGSVVVERIFSIQGMGLLFIQSLETNDLPTLMGLVLFSAVLTLLANLLADILYSVADPRVRFQ